MLIRPAVVGSIVAGLLLAPPVVSQDTDPVPPQDGQAAPQQDASATSSAATLPWLACATSCEDKCLGSPSPDRCATSFVSRRCSALGTQVGGVAKSKCLSAIGCVKDGNKVCDNNMQCLLQEQCCLDGDCDAESRCSNNRCVAKGAPSFTLSWTGFDDLELHVTTPDGFDLYSGAPYDPASGGRFQPDALPGDATITSRQESVYFPLDRTAPEGNYEYHVLGNQSDADPQRPFVIDVREGNILRARFRGKLCRGKLGRGRLGRGRLRYGAASHTYSYYFTP